MPLAIVFFFDLTTGRVRRQIARRLALSDVRSPELGSSRSRLIVARSGTGPNEANAGAGIEPG
jgi:hypothetical protein